MNPIIVHHLMIRDDHNLSPAGAHRYVTMTTAPVATLAMSIMNGHDEELEYVPVAEIDQEVGQTQPSFALKSTQNTKGLWSDRLIVPSKYLKEDLKCRSTTVGDALVIGEVVLIVLIDGFMQVSANYSTKQFTFSPIGV